MTEHWLFPFGILVILFVLLVAFGGLAAGLEALWSRIPPRISGLLGGLLIVMFIAYVLAVFAYAVLNPAPGPDSPPPASPGPPISPY